MFETAVMVAVVDVLCNSLMSEEHNYLFIINKCNVTSSETYISMENHYAQKVISVYQYIYLSLSCCIIPHYTNTSEEGG